MALCQSFKFLAGHFSDLYIKVPMMFGAWWFGVPTLIALVVVVVILILILWFSVEEAKKRIYACSTTTYEGFQVVMTEEESNKFQGNCFCWYHN
jgi:uncharacterized protein YpmS